MAITIDRTNYNALVDDDGTNTKGTPWSKNQVKIVLMDPIDAALAKVAGVSGSTGVVFGPQPPGLVTPAATAQFNISGSNPLILQSSDAGALANDKTWDIIAQTLSLTFRAVKDGFTAANAWMVVNRTTGNAGIANVNFPSAVIVGGLLSVSAVGTHSFVGSGPGAHNIISLRSTVPGGSAQFYMGADLAATTTVIAAFAQGFPGSGFNFADGTTIIANGLGGMSIGTGANAAVRFYQNAAERMRIEVTGFISVNLAQNYINAKVGIAYDATHGMSLHHTAAAGGLSYVVFLNAANGTAGSISQPTEATVSYNTASDARLKIDQGRATNLEALRAVVVHDFRWKADGEWGRGVFAQEAHTVFPRAVTPGTDDLTDGGDLKSPWMTDCSKFVPDLIAGFQQHDAALAQLRATLAALMKG